MPVATPAPSRLRIYIITLTACLLATAWAAPTAASELEERAQETLVRLALEGPEAAVPELEGLLDEAHAAEDPRAEGMVLWGLAAALTWVGDFETAEGLAAASEEVWEALDEPEWVKRAEIQAGIARALAEEPPARAAAGRAAFVADVSLLEVGQGRFGNALRLIERAISALDGVDDPIARQLSGPLILARETLNRTLGLPVDSSGALTRIQGTLPFSEDEVEILSGIFELMELGDRDAAVDPAMRRLAKLIREDPELADHELQELFNLYEASRREGFPAYLAHCGYMPDGTTSERPATGDANDPLEFICSYLELLEPTIASRRMEIQTVRNVLGRMMETFATGESGSQVMAGRTVLALENALDEPTAPEDWPSTNEFAALLEAGERRYADVPLELRAGTDSALSAFTQAAVRFRIRAGDPAGAFDLAERARARAFLDRLTAKRAARIEPGALEQIAALRRQRDDLGLRLVELSGTDPAGPEAVRLAEERATAQAEIETAFRRLALNAPLAERAPLASLEDVRRNLDEDTTLVAFMDFPDQPERPLAWVVDRRSGGGLRTYAFPAEYLESRIALLAQQIRNGHDEAATAEELYGALWAPLAEHIDTPRVVLVPHGVFQNLPFAALRDPDTGRRLIEDHALLHAPSASAWVHLASDRDPAAPSVLILGDPGGDLPGAAEAAREIGVIWGTPPLLADSATERALRERASGAGLIHVGSHGRQTTEPAFTHLRLAREAGELDDPRTDGRLELHEISEQLDLGRTTLAVLPACHTGAGPRTRGDEVASLAWAFLLAGARSVVTTGWAVDDGATAALMVDFHRHLAAGVEAAEALRRAQITALRSPDRSRPRHWAAFALHGAGGRVVPVPSRNLAPAGEIVLSHRTLGALEVFAQEGWADTAVLEDGLRAAQAANVLEDEVALLWGLSHAAIEEGRFADAVDLAQRGRAASEALGDREWTQRLVNWEGLAAALDGGEAAAPPVLRALFLAELMQIEMDSLRIGEVLRQADLALGLIDGLGQDDLALRLRLVQAAASGTGNTSEATLARLSAVMEEGAEAVAADRIEGRPDVTPLINALPELMLSLSSGNFSAGLKVLEGLAEEHGDLLSPELIGLLDMVGHLEDQNTEAAIDWCQRAEGSAHLVPDPSGSEPSSLPALLCSLADFLAATEGTDQGAVDLTAVGDLLQAAGSIVESQEGPFAEPLRGLQDYALELLRATQSGGEMPSTDDLLVALQDLDTVPSALPPTRRAGFDEAFVAPFGHFSTWLSVLTGNAEDSFRVAETVRAREFLDRLDLRLHTGGNGEAAAAITKLRRRAEALEARLLELSTRDPQDPEVSALKDQIEALRIEIDDRFGRLALSHGETARTPPSPLAEIQAALGDDTTLVSYLIPSFNEDDSLSEAPLAWVVDRDAIELVQLDVDAETLASDVRLFVERLRARQSSDEVAERLYSALWRPLRSHVGTRRVLVVPHGVLLDLPFAALRNPDSGAELVREATLLYAPSASAWTRLRDRASGNGSRVVMGNPTRNLAAAESEARALADLWGTTALTGGAASERRFRELAPGASLVHVASHGVLAPVDPAFSYLSLAPSPDAEADPRGDGRLELHEILGDLDLSGTGLVVLSSCQAGAGPTTRGGEMANLARAFLLAGVRSTVTAAWDVDDRAAEVLMVDFHRRLATGTEAAEALRGAQEAALADGKYSHPGFWASFALYGAGGGVTSPDRR